MELTTHAPGMFMKLDIRHQVPYERSLEDEYKIMLRGALNSVRYDRVDRSPLVALEDESWKDFYCTLMTIDAEWVPPHVDNNKILTVINFYIQTADAITTFYHHPAKYRRLRLHNHTTGYLVHDDDVTPAASFKAMPGEVYILNTAELHSVKSDRREQRIAYQLQTPTEYAPLLAKLGLSDERQI